MVSQLPIVGVMGSGTSPFPHLAGPLGELIAVGGCHLLTGGGGGVMAEVSRAFTDFADRKGLSIGVIRSDGPPQRDETTGGRRYRPVAVNSWVEVPIFTHLPLSSEAWESRNHINVLTAHALVALPGGAGTLSEVRLRLEYGGPAIVFLGDPKEGNTIGGRTALELQEELRNPEKLMIARTLQQAGWYIGSCVRRPE